MPVLMMVFTLQRGMEAFKPWSYLEAKGETGGILWLEESSVQREESGRATPMLRSQLPDRKRAAPASPERVKGNSTLTPRRE